MNTVWKKDYEKHIVKDSDYVQQYIKDTLNELDDVEMKVYKQGKGIEQAFDTWNEREKGINDAVVRRALDSGLPDEVIDKFMQYDVRDLYNVAKQNSVCFTCKKGKDCGRHMNSIKE